MKKITVLALLFSIVAFAGNSFAATAIAAAGATYTATTGDTIYGAATAGATTGGSAIGRLSKNVNFGVNYLATGASYALTTFCVGGSKMFGTANDATAIYSKEATAVAAPSAAGASSFATGWTSM